MVWNFLFGDRNLLAVGENLGRVQDLGVKLVLPETSHTLVLLQKGLNALYDGAVDYKPLEENGKVTPEFLEAFKNYLADKRAESGYSALPAVEGREGLTHKHIAAVLDSLYDRKLLTTDGVGFKREMLGMAREVNHFYMTDAVKGLEEFLKSKGIELPSASPASHSQIPTELEPYLDMHRSMKGPLRPT